MKNIFFFLITTILVIGSSYTTTQANAKVELSSDAVGLLCVKYGINQTESACFDDETNPFMTLIANRDAALIISDEEMDLLAQLVHAEAKGEPYDGKVAVATVVLNRIEHDEFPDTVEEVIYEKNAFEPVQNNSIYEPADQDSYDAVEEALLDRDDEGDVVFFYNPETATSDWIFTREVVKVIGNHAFAI
ncbi:cell wall hydrolase [Alkalihalobacillus sp. MEB130]|uniref:cell wall hydrolase n=1 Tax=Alkalihalobacillus sp. MEB130 TaxID=2976704 RepID=UPI0028DDE802|nr:cell wall hydrolase [Alkalihalobacillus sp. MEB130]MDT8860771.1 cell wall hydrolase [Alkalihalobacillus sp. MEB130]